MLNVPVQESFDVRYNVTVKQSFHYLLEAVPKEIPLDFLKEQLRQVPGVLGFHDLHINALTTDVVLSTVHLACDSPDNYARIAQQVCLICLCLALACLPLPASLLPASAFALLLPALTLDSSY